MYNRKSRMESVVRAIFVGVIIFSMIAGIILAEQVRTVTALTEKNIEQNHVSVMMAR